MGSTSRVRAIGRDGSDDHGSHDRAQPGRDAEGPVGMRIPMLRAPSHVDFAGLKEGSELAIRTRNTEYRFVVVDPAIRLGLLSGGTFETAQEAVLACLTDEVLRGPGGPRPSSRALFHLFVDGRRKTLTTSPIREIRAVGVSPEPVSSSFLPMTFAEPWDQDSPATELETDLTCPCSGPAPSASPGEHSGRRGE
jgi:hypothetical protein